MEEHESQLGCESAGSIITALAYCNAAHASTVFSVDDKIDDASLPSAASAVLMSAAVAYTYVEFSLDEMVFGSLDDLLTC